MNALRSLSLGAKLNLFLLAFLLLLGAATSAIIIFSFSRAQDRTQERSNAALEEQGKLVLQALAGGVSGSGGLQIEWAAEIGQRAGRYLQERDASEPAPPFDASRLVRNENGVWYDPDPARASDIIIPNHVEALTPQQLDDITYSAALDPLFPALVEGFPGELSGEGFRPIAVVFDGSNGVVRYYPPIGVHETTPAEIEVPNFYDLFGPVANPDRLTTWTPPYEDVQGRGLVLTAQTPVYEGDVFRGIFEVDLSIDGLAAELDGIHPTPGGFAFYVDTEGEILRSEAFDLLSREAGANPTLDSVLQDMRLGVVEGPRPGVEKVTLDDRDYFISYYPLPAAGGSIAVAAPVDEVTDQAAAITASISDEGTRTLQVMLTALGALFVVGLGAATYLNRRVLIGPLRNLTAATRQVAGGDLTANVASGRKDELGELAADFNVMVEQLRESERSLEQRVDDRTRELSTLLEVARNVGSTLELQPLLQLILEQVRTLAPYDRSLVMIREADELRVLAMRAEPGFEMEPSQMQLRAPIADGGLIWELIERGEPAIIEDTRGDTALAEAWRKNNAQVLESALQRVGSWMAVPIRLGDRTIGMLVTSKEERGFFTQRHAELVTAIGTHAGMAINNAQLFEETQRQARDLEALARADAELFRSLDLDHVLTSMVDVAVDILGADKGMVMLHQGNVDVIRAQRNCAPENIAEFNRALAGIPHDEPDPATQSPQVYTSLDEAPQFIAGGLAREGIVSHMSVPIRDTQQMLGVFSVSFVEAHSFTDDEKRLYTALADRAAVAIQNADLYAKAQHAASLEERQRLARELHDSVSQALYGIALGTRTARMRLGNDTNNAAEPLDYIASLAQAGLAEMRALIFELRPESLEEEGLVAAIEKQAASVGARYKLEVALELGEEPVCSLDAKEALYRITQEALHNVVKHAQATHVEVRLLQQNGSTILAVRDDGRGFDPTASFPGHVGLQSMPERAMRLGGTVEIESAPGQGTTVTATLPLT